MNEPPVNAFAAQHGIYRQESIPVTAGEFEEGEPTGNVRVWRNRGGTTVERWLPTLTSAQAEAMSLYARAWHMFIGEQRITANWSLTAFIRGMPMSQWLQSQTDAKEMILHLDKTVFNKMPGKYVDVWKNILIFDKSADGVGRELLGANARSADVEAKRVCLFIADMIATVLRLGTE